MILVKANLRDLKTFFIWYKLHHPQAQRINSFVFLWGTLRQLYYNWNGYKMEDQGYISRVSSACTGFIASLINLTTLVASRRVLSAV